MEQKTEATTEEMTARRDWLWSKTGQHQFTKAVVEAELIQMNQEILDINNKLQLKFKAATPAPKIVEPEVLPPEAPAESMGITRDEAIAEHLAQ